MVNHRPSESEIRSELETLLNHPRFEQAVLQRNLLETAAQWALAGREFNGHDLGFKIIPLYDKTLSSDIRKAKNLLQKWLYKYYQSEGRADPVQIRFSKTGFSVSFTYNPSTPFLEHMAFLRATVAGFSPHSMLEVISQINFDLAPPDDISCFVFYCETLLAYACFDQAQHQDVMERALAIATSVVEKKRMEPGNWRGRAVLAAAQLCWGLRDEAALNFHRAMALDQSATKQYGWYWAFLITDDRIPEAIELIGRHCREKPTEPIPRVILALAFYLARDYAASVDHAAKSVALSQSCWLGHFVTALAEHELGLEKEAVVAYLRAKQLLGLSGVEFFPGFLLLLAQSQEVREEIKSLYDTYRSLVSKKKEDGSFDFINCAIGFAKISPRTAARAFKGQMNTHIFPPFLWAKLWPFFDYLRKEPDFIDTLEAIKQRQHSTGNAE